RYRTDRRLGHRIVYRCSPDHHQLVGRDRGGPPDRIARGSPGLLPGARSGAPMGEGGGLLPPSARELPRVVRREPFRDGRVDVDGGADARDSRSVGRGCELLRQALDVRERIYGKQRTDLIEEYD